LQQLAVVFSSEVPEVRLVTEHFNLMWDKMTPQEAKQGIDNKIWFQQLKSFLEVNGTEQLVIALGVLEDELDSAVKAGRKPAVYADDDEQPASTRRRKPTAQEDQDGETPTSTSPGQSRPQSPPRDTSERSPEATGDGAKMAQMAQELDDLREEQKEWHMNRKSIEKENKRLKNDLQDAMEQLEELSKAPAPGSPHPAKEAEAAKVSESEKRDDAVTSGALEMIKAEMETLKSEHEKDVNRYQDEISRYQDEISRLKGMSADEISSDSVTSGERDAAVAAATADVRTKANAGNKKSAIKRFAFVIAKLNGDQIRAAFTGMQLGMLGNNFESKLKAGIDENKGEHGAALTKLESSLEDMSILKERLESKLGAARMGAAVVQFKWVIKDEILKDEVRAIRNLRANFTLDTNSKKEKLSSAEQEKKEKASEKRLEAIREDGAQIQSNLKSQITNNLKREAVKRMTHVLAALVGGQKLQAVVNIRTQALRELGKQGIHETSALYKGRMQASSTKILSGILASMKKNGKTLGLLNWRQNCHDAAVGGLENTICEMKESNAELQSTLHTASEDGTKVLSAQQMITAFQRRRRSFERGFIHNWYKNSQASYMEEHIYAVEALAHTQITAMRGAENRHNLDMILKNDEFIIAVQGHAMHKLKYVFAFMIHGTIGAVVQQWRSNKYSERINDLDTRHNMVVAKGRSELSAVEERHKKTLDSMQKANEKEIADISSECEYRLATVEVRLNETNQRHNDRCLELEITYREEIEALGSEYKERMEDMQLRVRHQDEMTAARMKEKLDEKEADLKIEWGQKEAEIEDRLLVLAKSNVEEEMSGLKMELQEYKNMIDLAQMDADEAQEVRNELEKEIRDQSNSLMDQMKDLMVSVRPVEGENGSITESIIEPEMMESLLQDMEVLQTEASEEISSPLHDAIFEQMKKLVLNLQLQLASEGDRVMDPEASRMQLEKYIHAAENYEKLQNISNKVKVPREEEKGLELSQES